VEQLSLKLAGSIAHVRTAASDRRYIAELLGVALAYGIAAKLGLSLAGSTKQVTTVWPAAGIALGILLVWGYRYVPGVLLGAFVANVMTHEPALVAAGIAIGNTLEVLVAAQLLQRVVKFDNTLKQVKDLLGFMFFAGLVSAVIAASVGTTSLALAGITSWSHYWSVWIVWWAGDALGIMLFTPLILAYASRGLRRAFLRAPYQAAGFMTFLYVSTMVVYASAPDAVFPRRPVGFLVFPLMILIAFRFQQIGVVTGAVIIALTALWATAAHLGPFANGSLEQNLVLLQIYILSIALTSMLLAITVDQRNRASQALERRTEELHNANERITGIITDMLKQGSNEERELSEAEL
jgi:integral membrane sensor domain MASE1